MSDENDRPDEATRARLVGGSALPFGVMMRAGDRISVCVRRPDDSLAVRGFTAPTPWLSRHRLARLPGIRALFSIRASGTSAKRAFEVMADLIEEPRETDRTPPSRPMVALAAVAGGLIGLSLQFLLFRLGPLVLAKEAGLTGAAFILAEATLRVALLLGTLRLIALAPRSRKLLAYHGAEHQAIAAHEAGGPLTAAHAGRFSRFHPRCGTSFLIGSALISIPIYGAILALTGAFSYTALILTRIICAPFITAIALEGQRLVSKGSGRTARILRMPGMTAQRLTTAEPGPRELEVACCALDDALRAGSPSR
ncbi:DUF1385 domain-containing protein [Miltoncostaea oceani]|uniref:DUF1385 domain-containing protein n=1 Tax=Miltoncostaea oceani TaxID=2843216 RepID=UPI001C3D6954|nr:DUF1385 domain-containing protein [Miltoncostaea oceani]